jgi:Uma2 family endonuclease
MAALPQLISVEQFRQMPDGGYAYELHHGEVVAMTRPKHRHLNLQHQFFRLLEPRLKPFGEVAIELPYRPFPEFDLRVADVAAVSRARWDAIDPDDNLHGVPELVIEVKSPSNTERQLRELVSICLNEGAVEVWIVESDRKSVTVFRGDGAPVVFGSGAGLSLAAFGGEDLLVDEIFSYR